MVEMVRCGMEFLRFLGVLVVVPSVILSGYASPDIIQAESCSRAHVQEAVDAASDGDIIQVPPGTCTYTSMVSITNKEVTVLGSGIDQTIIEDATTGPNNAPFWIKSDKPFRISGFTFTGQSSAKGIIHAEGNSRGWRVDHNKFLDIGHKAFDFWSITAGVIDHNLFVGHVKGMNLSGPVSNWSEPWQPGSAEAIFIEDNIFDHSIRYAAVSCHNGCRYVFRYNLVKNGGVSTHGADSSARGGGSMEVYENVFESDPEHDRVIRWRGGTGIIFNNEFKGYQRAMEVALYRACYGISWDNADASNASRCDGTQPIDGNLPVQTGTHNGGQNSAFLMDSTQAWSTNQEDDLVGFQIRNTTDGSSCQVEANSSQTVSCQLQGGEDNNWDVGDKYEVITGWPCKDQPGRGPNQSSEPIYHWNNTHNRYGTEFTPVIEIEVAGYTCENPSPSDQFKEGRDWFNNTPRPGYEPFTYPHPLVGGGSVPEAPTNLRITSPQ